ncbi:MAG: GNAT family N-acetyltransferase [Parvibaculum sp.]|nr:GNAT family N-acetyltransferase [Parvibaculum sp.]
MDVRLGTATDLDDLVRFLLMAGEGLFEYLFDDAYPGLTARDALALGVGDAESPYHFENAYLVESDNRVVGCLIAFPAEQVGLPELAYSVLTPDRLDPVRPLFEEHVPGSLYINTLAVDESARGQGVGGLLLDFAAELAQGAGCTSMTLHAWGDNETALSLYNARGFECVDKVEIPRTAKLRHDAPMLLLQCPVA